MSKKIYKSLFQEFRNITAYALDPARYPFTRALANNLPRPVVLKILANRNQWDEVEGALQNSEWLSVVELISDTSNPRRAEEVWDEVTEAMIYF